jgi:hypothetical protein
MKQQEVYVLADRQNILIQLLKNKLLNATINYYFAKFLYYDSTNYRIWEIQP